MVDTSKALFEIINLMEQSQVEYSVSVDKSNDDILLVLGDDAARELYKPIRKISLRNGITVDVKPLSSTVVLDCFSDNPNPNIESIPDNEDYSC